MDAAFFRDWMTAAAAVVENQRDHLTQLDAAIGDADHGINMARGFGAVTAALEQKDTPTPGAVLTLVGLASLVLFMVRRHPSRPAIEGVDGAGPSTGESEGQSVENIQPMN